MSGVGNLGVYLVTDPDLCARAGRSVADTVVAAVRAGVRIVQVRAKDADGGPFLEHVLEVAAALAGVPGASDTLLIVNDRVDVALAARVAGAAVAGVHVGQRDLPAAAARSLLWPGAILGVSAAEAELIVAAEPYADYVGIGSVRDTATKADAAPPLGVDRIVGLARETQLPAVAIGGVKLPDLGGLRHGGVAGAAVVSAICSASDPGQAARVLVDEWNRPPQPREQKGVA